MRTDSIPRTGPLAAVNDISLSIAEPDRAYGAEEVIMSGSNMGDWFGGGAGGSTRGSGQGWPMSGLWEAMEQLRGQFEQKVGGTRMGRGDVRTAVLALLAEKPMHGYQIIQQIEERSGGAWKPSPGSVYPTLQLLADEGLINAEESDGRKTYSLTEEGRRSRMPPPRSPRRGRRRAPARQRRAARCRRPGSTSLRPSLRSGARAARSR